LDTLRTIEGGRRLPWRGRWSADPQPAGERRRDHSIGDGVTVRSATTWSLDRRRRDRPFGDGVTTRSATAWPSVRRRR